MCLLDFHKSCPRLMIHVNCAEYKSVQHMQTCAVPCFVRVWGSLLHYISSDEASLTAKLPCGVFAHSPQEEFNPVLICSYHQTSTWRILSELISLTGFSWSGVKAGQMNDATLICVWSAVTAVSWQAVTHHFSLRWKYDRREIPTEAALLWC